MATKPSCPPFAPSISSKPGGPTGPRMPAQDATPPPKSNWGKANHPNKAVPGDSHHNSPRSYRAPAQRNAQPPCSALGDHHHGVARLAALDVRQGGQAHRHPAQSLLTFMMAIKASYGTDTLPRALRRFLPSRCLSSSFFLRWMSPP